MKFKILAAALIFLLMVGCGPKEDPLRMVVIPSEDASLTKQQWAQVIDYLSEGLGRQVDLIIVSDYAGVVEAMKYGHADIARLSPAGYVAAIDQGAEIEPIAVAIKASTGQPGYYGYLVTRPGVDITNLNDMTFAFVDVGSTSGYIVPSIYLEEEGIEPKEMLFAGSHSAVILAVKNGTVDVGATCDNRVDIAIQEDVIKKDDLSIIWQSDLIPNCPIAIQSSLPDSLKDKLTELLLAIPEEVMSATMVGEIGYVEASDADYDSIREIIRYKDE